MRADRIVSLVVSLLTFTFLFSLVLLVGCGKKATESKRASSSDEIQLQAMYDTAITRLRHMDKSGLYDLEFEYIREKFSFADYQAFPQILTVEADTTDSLRIDSVSFYGGDSLRDSAKVWFTTVFRGPTNHFSYLYNQWHICCFHQGRWIRPTVGVVQNQLSFDSLKNAAFDAANKESGG